MNKYDSETISGYLEKEGYSIDISYPLGSRKKLNKIVKKKFDSLNKKPLNFSYGEAPNSQNLPDVIKLNFAINILPTELMKKKKSLIGDNPYFFKIDQTESFDINTHHDFDVAEILYKKKGKIRETFWVD